MLLIWAFRNVRGESDAIEINDLATIDLEVRDETGLDRKLRLGAIDRC